MKYILLLFSLLMLAVHSMAQRHYSDGQAWLLADSVNLRLSPVDGEIIARLPIASELKVVQRAEAPFDQWLKVTYTEGEETASGFLLERFVAEEVHIDEKTSNIFLIGTIKMRKGEYGSTPIVQLRVANNNTELARTEIEGIHNDGFYTELWEDGKGLDSVHNIVTIDFAQNCCACPTGKIYFFWTGSSLVNAFTVHDGSDVPYFGATALIFPHDNGGLWNTVIHINYSGHYNDDYDDQAIIEHVRTTFHYWDTEKIKITSSFIADE